LKLISIDESQFCIHFIVKKWLSGLSIKSGRNSEKFGTKLVT
jgi:hypothetical protein